MFVHRPGFRIVLQLGLLGCGLGAGLAHAIGPGEPATSYCAIAWQQAGDRSQGYLTDRAATPYLAMMLAHHFAPPPDYRISEAVFIEACEAGAIWRIAPAAEEGSPAHPGRATTMIRTGG